MTAFLPGPRRREAGDRVRPESARAVPVLLLLGFLAPLVAAGWWEFYLVPLAEETTASGNHGELYGPVLGLRRPVLGISGAISASCLLGLAWWARGRGVGRGGATSRNDASA
jgi:hypothetical protein